MEEAAEANCDNLVARALSIAPDNPEAQLSLASIRMSQQRFDEAKEVIVKMYKDIEGLESCESSPMSNACRTLLAHTCSRRVTTRPSSSSPPFTSAARAHTSHSRP